MVVDQSGQEAGWLPWAPGQPEDFPGWDCVYYSLDTDLASNDLCAGRTCPVCEVSPPPQNFVLRGVCLTSNVDSLFVMKSSTEFLGYIQTRMVYSTKTDR